MNLAIRISSLAAGLIAAGGGPARPMPGDKIARTRSGYPTRRIRRRRRPAPPGSSHDDRPLPAAGTATRTAGPTSDRCTRTAGPALTSHDDHLHKRQASAPAARPAS
jgi:hypothetical protein